MNFYRDKIAERLGGRDFGSRTELYKFEKIKRNKAEAVKNRPDLELIDLGVGEPDKPADAGIVRILANEAGKPGNRFYADNGIAEFQEAAARFLQSYFHVEGLNPYTNIVHGIGSKPILALLPLCFINPGDICLATVPGYGVIQTYTRYIGGSVYTLPLTASNGFLPDLESVPHEVRKNAKLLYLNYPNNPTGTVAAKEFFLQAVKFARNNGIILVHDAAYACLTYDGNEPLSLLSVEGGRDVAVEIHSLSKSFNMTGWRLGFAAGSSSIIKTYATVKDNTDSGQFRAIQKAGVYALDHPELIEENRERYSRRFDLLVDVLNNAGFTVNKPGGTFYCYVKAPVGIRSGVSFPTAEAASEYLLKQALISTVPWDDAGAYLRISVTFTAETHAEEKTVMEELGRRLSALELVF